VKNWRVVIAVIIFLVAVIVALDKLPGLRTSIPGAVVRFCLGEPGATQWVNNTADTIIDSGWTKELEVLSDQLCKDFQSDSKSLPVDKFSRLPTLPSARLPLKFKKLGSWPRGDVADLFERPEENGPSTIIISWGHGREEVIIFGNPQSVPPKGFFVRKVGSRIYVVANES
jgi:hypothetical protein